MIGGNVTVFLSERKWGERPGHALTRKSEATSLSGCEWQRLLQRRILTAIRLRCPSSSTAVCPSPVRAANTVTVGSTAENHAGLLARARISPSPPLLSIPASFPADTLDFLNLQVSGNARFTLGNGGDTVTIDDSQFHGTFTLTPGTGSNFVKLETTAGTAGPSIYDGPVVMYLGTSNTAVTLTGLTDSGNQELIIFLARSSFTMGPAPAASERLCKRNLPVWHIHPMGRLTGEQQIPGEGSAAPFSAPSPPYSAERVGVWGGLLHPCKNSLRFRGMLVLPPHPNPLPRVRGRGGPPADFPCAN